MHEVEQNMMCALLQTLWDRKLITQDVYNKSREKILGTLGWPEFFCYSEKEEKEDDDGHTKNPR